MKDTRWKDFLSFSEQLNDLTYMDGRDMTKSELRNLARNN